VEALSRIVLSGTDPRSAKRFRYLHVAAALAGSPRKMNMRGEGGMQAIGSLNRLIGDDILSQPCAAAWITRRAERMTAPRVEEAQPDH